MSQFYTLTLRRKSLRFFPDGTVEEHFKEETQHRVPAMLVNTWRKLFPAAVVSAVQEDQIQDHAARDYHFGFKRGELEIYDGADRRASIRERTKKARSVLASDEPGIIGGSYADAINKALEEKHGKS